MIETVRGRVEELGSVLMHEHIFGLSPEILWNWPDVPEGWDLERCAQDAAAKLEAVRALGVDTIVDLTVIGLGRYVPAVQRVAELTSVNIVVATGLYTYDELPAYFGNRGPGTLFGGDDRMAEFFVRDITEGIGRTGVRAAMLKCATGRKGMTPGVERVIRACARAHRETGAPITTHSESSVRNGLDQQKLLREEGVDLRNVVIGHAGDSTDLSYLRELADNGSFLGMDRFGIEFTSFEDRVNTVAELCRLGYASSMVFGHDSYCFNDRFDWDVIRERHPDYHLAHISTDVVPALLAREVTPEQLELMFVGNPRRVLTPVTPY